MFSVVIPFLFNKGKSKNGFCSVMSLATLSDNLDQMAQAGNIWLSCPPDTRPTAMFGSNLMIPWRPTAWTGFNTAQQWTWFVLPVQTNSEHCKWLTIVPFDGGKGNPLAFVELLLNHESRHHWFFLSIKSQLLAEALVHDQLKQKQYVECDTATKTWTHDFLPSSCQALKEMDSLTFFLHRQLRWVAWFKSRLSQHVNLLLAWFALVWLSPFNHMTILVLTVGLSDSSMVMNALTTLTTLLRKKELTFSVVDLWD